MGSIPIARSKIVDDSIALTPWKPLKNAFGMAGFVPKNVPKRAELFQDRTFLDSLRLVWTHSQFDPGARIARRVYSRSVCHWRRDGVGMSRRGPNVCPFTSVG
jgi:hypothetical protein